YGIPDAHKCINENLPLHLILDIDVRQKPDPMNSKYPSLDGYKIFCEDLLSRILIACADIIYFDLKHLITLNAFTLASLSNANKCSWHIVYNYAHFVDYRDLRGFVKKVAKRKLKREEKFQPIEDETTLSKGASLQKQYKPDYKGLVFGEATDIIKLKDRPIQKIVDRVANIVAKPHPFVELPGKVINVKRLKDKTTTLREIIMALKNKVESLSHIKFIAHPFVVILDETNVIMYQMSSDTNAQKSENTMCDVLRSARHVLAIDAFANISMLAFLKAYHDKDIYIIDNRYQPYISKTVEILYDLNSEAEAMQIGCELLKHGKCVVFASTGVVITRALVEKASKLIKPDNSHIRAHAYYENMDEKQ
ncbi:75_t:CDS:2, partial [Cetraspora pellucida]